MTKTTKRNSPPAVDDPALYLNRELSLLAFNHRVLQQARDASVPLLERARFLAISSSNLDEFFEVRVAGLKQQLAYGLPRRGVDGLTTSNVLRKVADMARQLVSAQYQVLNDELLPALVKEGIFLARRKAWKPAQSQWVRTYFREQVLPVLSPIGLDPAHPFPQTLNKALNFLVTMEGADAFGRQSGVAIVRVPRSLPRIIRLPHKSADETHLALLSSVIHANVDQIFPGMRTTGCFQFRVTRNSDLWVDEEEVENLLAALRNELLSRHYGDAVRLEIADNCSQEMEHFLREQYDLEPHECYRVGGPVNLHRLSALPEMVDRPDLRYPGLVPRSVHQVLGLPDRSIDIDIFATIKRRDILLHHPFDAFTTVVDMLRSAAADPDVLGIKQTLYRTGEDSDIVVHLADAARAGKEVAVVIELKARFDEAENIKLATYLQDAGVNVVYGLVGHKTHSKMMLIVRREQGELVRYAHVGTGNYHQKTARLYTDVGLMTADQRLTADIASLFQLLTGLGEVPTLAKIAHAPFTLHQALIKHIDAETKRAKDGQKDTRIIAKMNSLTEPRIIQALYAASQAGVKIDLIVRGICCLRPGVVGVSDNIVVRSVIGRFLEHSRVFFFAAGGKEKLFISSADWMDRNFFRRAEVCVPILDSHVKERLIHETLQVYLEDTASSWLLQEDGSYRRPKPNSGTPVQLRLLSR